MFQGFKKCKSMVMLNFPLIVVDLNGFHIGGILFECHCLAAFTTQQQHSLPLTCRQPRCMHKRNHQRLDAGKIGARGPLSVGFSENEAATDGTKLDLNIGGFSRVWRL